MNDLHHVEASLFVNPFVRYKLCESCILDIENDKYVLPSIYKDLFYEWTNMDFGITFHGQGQSDLEDHTLMINPKKIVTLEEKVDGMFVGYYFYEKLGIRNYILDKLNVNFESRPEKDLKFKIVLTKDQYKKFMKMDEKILNKLSQQYGVNKDSFLHYIQSMKNRDKIKKVTCKSYRHMYKAYIKVNAEFKINYICKHIVTKNTEQYVLAICDGCQIPEEIFQTNYIKEEICDN